MSLDEDVLDTIDANSPRLYGFLNDHRSNYCGQKSNGDQYLLYNIYEGANTLILKFSASGELIEISEKGDLKDLYDDDLAVLAAEMGIHEMQVTVQKFFLLQQDFGIIDLPFHHQAFLADRSTVPEEAHHQYEEDIEHWLISMCFVLWLGHHDYWLSPEGHITAT